MFSISFALKDSTRCFCRSGVEQHHPIFMNVSGRHMSSFKYEFHGFSHMNYKFAGAWRV